MYINIFDIWWSAVCYINVYVRIPHNKNKFRFCFIKLFPQLPKQHLMHPVQGRSLRFCCLHISAASKYAHFLNEERLPNTNGESQKIFGVASISKDLVGNSSYLGTPEHDTPIPQFRRNTTIFAGNTKIMGSQYI